MATILTDGAPFFVSFLPCMSVGDMPAGVEDWMQTWNNSNDCYVSLHLDHLENDEDVATDETRTWLAAFRAKYPGHEIVLIHIDY